MQPKMQGFFPWVRRIGKFFDNVVLANSELTTINHLQVTKKTTINNDQRALTRIDVY